MSKKDKKKSKKKPVVTTYDLFDYIANRKPVTTDLPIFHAQRGGITYEPATNFTSHSGGGDHMGLSISRLAQVASLVAFGAAALGNVLFGHGGLELVSAGLFLHVGADVLEDVLAG